MRLFCCSLATITTTAIPNSVNERTTIYPSTIRYTIRVQLMGFETSRLILNPVFKNKFLYKDFHLVRFDSRGVLDSGKPTDLNQYTLDHHAQDLKAVVDAITNANPGKKITLVGWNALFRNFGEDKVNGFVTIGAKLERIASDSASLAFHPTNNGLSRNNRVKIYQ
ncbi:12842_t:CDS:2 [Ambispora leptoticha]|uniref:12842_t:CDS:1 n=1 Tax=Ambispora leptoticha TaxID=144679 RepID=A0A9N9BC81_9GLOM|nr:12842_t:CDS:2 [Ambispora leptoticha]